MNKFNNNLRDLCKLARYYILYSVNEANSGHTTSALSAVELMVTLYFSTLRQDLDNLEMCNNDHVIFSKGHATPLIYALYAIAGKLTIKDLAGFRSIDSPLEGHPTYRFKYTDVPTGSLGQGLSIGLGHAFNAKYFDRLPYKTYVLMGDGEMAEGQVWEAFSFATHYSIDNIIVIVDVNRLGQTQETQYGWNTQLYEDRLEAFGWATRSIDGHNINEILNAYEWAQNTGKPSIIFAKTIKGKGFSFWENQNGWHSQPVPEDRFKEAVSELGEVDFSAKGYVKKPKILEPKKVLAAGDETTVNYKLDDVIATKRAFGETMLRLAPKYPNVILLDGDVKNSTHAEYFANNYPKRFVECYIAEQNMVSFAQGLSLHDKKPFVVTFAAFLTRAFDQFRMASLGGSNIKVVGSYVGASIGKDGPSNMGMEDIAMFRSLHGSTLLYPADGIATEKMVETMIRHDEGIIYLRTTREPLPNIYKPSSKFPIGGSKTLRKTDNDSLVIIAAGITLHEALIAYERLLEDDIKARIIDSYSIKPIDKVGLTKAAKESNGIVLVVEDHWHEGGLGDAVLNVFAKQQSVQVHKIAVSKMPKSGNPKEVLKYVGVDASSIYHYAKRILSDIIQ